MNQKDLISFIKRKDYIILNDNLGKGSFGKTALIKDPYIKSFFVAKKYEPENSKDKEKFFNNFIDEIKILLKLNHRNIVRIYNFYIYDKNNTGYIVMEYIEGTDIETYIVENVMEQNNLLDSIFIQLIDAFSYLEENRIIHRDIRSSNILVSEDGIVKIIDFGIGKVVDSTENEKDSLVLDINRNNVKVKPEEYDRGIYTTVTDMYYVGCLLDGIIKKIKSNYNFSYKDILKKMISVNPENRYSSFSEIKKIVDGINIKQKLNVNDKDIKIYQNFVNALNDVLYSYNGTQHFNTNPSEFSLRLRYVINTNLFETYIQRNDELIGCVVKSVFYNDDKEIVETEVVREFFEWFNGYNVEIQELILNNIKTKISKKPIYDY